MAEMHAGLKLSLPQLSSFADLRAILSLLWRRALHRHHGCSKHGAAWGGCRTCDLLLLMEQFHAKTLIDSLALRYVVFGGFSALPPPPLIPDITPLHAFPSPLPTQLLC